MTKANLERDAPLVLIVDDDRSMRIMAKQTLKQSGFRVAEANNGLTALAEVEALHPDMLLLDVMMPKMDGFTACAKLRELPHSKHIPVLMMTALDDVESINRAYETGATDFITKPINCTILAHRVRYMLRAQRTLEALRDSERRLTNAQRTARLGHWEWDMHRGLVDVSDQVYEIFALGREALDGSYENFLNLVHPDDRGMVENTFRECLKEGKPISVEHRIQLPNGDQRVVHQEVETPTLNDTRKILRVSGTIQDITERKQTEQKIFHIMHFDELTGLPNRRFFKQYLSYVIKQAKRYNQRMALLALDIDRFKRINDTLGRSAGDILLKEMARRFEDCVRESDCVTRLWGHETDYTGNLGEFTLARLGGDEFIVLLSKVRRPEDAAIAAERITAALSEPFVLKGEEVFATVSIGIILYPENGEDVDTLLKRADLAMHHAKDCGRNNYQFFSKSINKQARERMAMENSLWGALERREFLLHYQPKVNIQTGVTVGMEALVRWRHPEFGVVLPGKFIPVAEEIGLIAPLGEWVLRTACEQTKAWQRDGLPPLCVSVNLSAAQFKERSLVSLVEEVLKDVNLDPRFLGLEFTESLLMSDTEANIEMMQSLKSIGVELSIDDFGTGYSSLNYLRRFPIDALKIDRTFIKDIGSDENTAAIVNATIGLAHSLRLRVVAEGAEHREQVDILRTYGCEEIQGYWYSPPLPAEEFSEWVRGSLEGNPFRRIG